MNGFVIVNDGAYASFGGRCALVGGKVFEVEKEATSELKHLRKVFSNPDINLYKLKRIYLSKRAEVK